MTAPKVDTIRRYCDNSLAVEILQERGIITEAEASEFHARDRRKRAAAYAEIHSERIADFRCRNIGYGEEEGEVFVPRQLPEPDWTGKRRYLRTDGVEVFLFEDELIS